jgi:regulator of sigma E protease
LETLAHVPGMIFNVLKVVFGLGLVIFIHELGHFLAAKWNGVKVEKFYLGFDFFGFRIASFRRGETEYGIGGIPLGGYVKMLGEDPPSEGSEATRDPRAFSNKSISARTVILSAGVAMNILLGWIFFTTTHMLGVIEQPARIGWVQAGSPAYEAGLREGDEIVSMNGSDDVNYQRLRLKVSLSSANQKVVFGVKRPGVPELLTIPVEPRKHAKVGMPNIGVAPCRSLTFFHDAQLSDPPGSEGPAPAKDLLPPEGTIIEAGPSGGAMTKVDDIFALDRILYENRDKSVDIVVLSPKDKNKPRKSTRATLPVNHYLTFGFRLTPGKVTAIQGDSPAAKSGFLKDDRIIKVDGRDDFDPMHLPDDLHARAGKPTTFLVERQVDGKTQSVDLTVTPTDALPRPEPMGIDTESLKIPGLGLAMTIEPKIAAVDANSPAARAGIKPGAIIREMTIPPLKESKKDKQTRLVFSDSASSDSDAIPSNWPTAFQYLQVSPKSEVQLILSDSASPVSIRPEPEPSWTNPDRGLELMLIHSEIPPQPFGIAIKRGWDETYDNITTIYATIRSLFSGRVSTKKMVGLPGILGAAYQSADAGIVPLLSFLGMLSINLAVLNFLPIPPLDGGQIAFLLAEKVRGKPLPDSTLNVLIIAGLVLVLSLMVFTIGQDLLGMFFGKG